MKLLDLRKKENFQKVMASFRPKLEQELANSDNLEWWHRDALRRAMRLIDSGEARGKVQLVAGGILGPAFTEHTESLGYDGLIIYEGGETEAKASVGNHDTYLIFDPEKVKIGREHRIV